MVASRREIYFSVRHSVEREAFSYYCIVFSPKHYICWVAFTQSDFSIRTNFDFYFNLHRNWLLDQLGCYYCINQGIHKLKNTCKFK